MMKNLIARAASGEAQALAELLSVVEEHGPLVLKQPELLNPKNLAYRVGITGPPGAGKSSLVDGLIEKFKQKNLSVAVLAVDPSSPFTGGAILGDRIRYMRHTLDNQVFIRSIGTRGSLGGLSASAYLMLRVFDHAGFDVVLIETVGVGQTELEVIHVADFVAVVLVPESGDSIQAMKAGLVEIADIFVINKSDRPGAESFKSELKAVLGLEGERHREVISTVATAKLGLEELSEYILNSEKRTGLAKTRHSAHRLKQEALSLLRAASEEKLRSHVSKIKNSKNFLQVLLR